jgi:hypothetical protein
MMKILKFSEPLPELILNGQKDTTWRVTDHNIRVNDQLSLCHNNGEEFAKAKVLWVKQTTFGNVTDEDKKGHEKYKSDEELYKTFSGYYNKPITPQTELFVIKFKLIT